MQARRITINHAWCLLISGAKGGGGEGCELWEVVTLLCFNKGEESGAIDDDINLP